MHSFAHTDIELFAQRILSRLGLFLDENNASMLEQAMQKALQRTGCRNSDQYLQHFEDGAFANKEIRQLALELTVPETYFFRHAEQFQALEEVALPECIEAARPTCQLNLLSAGCASGEEPYSLAATVLKFPGLRNWQIRIQGMDINRHLLVKARDGQYSAWSLRAIPEAERAAYFRREGKHYILNEQCHSMVCFEEGNLLDSAAPVWRPNFFHIIFCRNVMIYFSPAAVRTLVDQLTNSLAPGGFLFLGPSETLRGLSQQYHLRHSHGAFYYQRKRKEELDSRDSVVQMHSPPKKLPGREPPVDSAWASAIAESTQRIAALTGERSGTSSPAGGGGASFPALQDMEELRTLLREERFEDALRAIDALSQENANDPDMLMIRGVLWANQGELDRAMQLCDQLLARDELRPGAHYLKAICEEKRGDHLSAAEHDQAAIYLNPKFAMPRLHLGLLARRLGDLQTARRELSEALLLLANEDSSRIVLFGGGFSREALMRFCQAQLELCGGPNA